MPPREPPSIFEMLFFLLAIGVYVWLGPLWFVRVVGVMCLVGAGRAVVTMKVPVGWRGHEAAFFLTGVAAVLYAIGLGALGILMVVFAPQVSAFWSMLR